MSEAIEVPRIIQKHPGKALDVNWDVVKNAMCALGMSFYDAEKSFGISHWSIRKRAERYEWPLPEKITAMANEVSKNRQIASVTAQNWAEKGEQHRGTMFKIASEALKDVEKAPPIVEGWADVERIDKMARRAAGLDNDETKVSNTFNFAMLGEDIDPEIKSVRDVGPDELTDCSTS